MYLNIDSIYNLWSKLVVICHSVYGENDTSLKKAK